MLDDELLQKIYSKVLTYFSLKDRSKKEVLDKINVLGQKYELAADDLEIITEALVTRLEEENILNDKRLAENFVWATTNSSKPRGKNYISNYLFKKGISKQIVDAAISVISDEDDLENALKTANKKTAIIKEPDEYKRKSKLWAFLSRRGFQGDTITRAVDILLGVK